MGAFYCGIVVEREWWERWDRFGWRWRMRAVNEALGLAFQRPFHVWGTATANFSVTLGLALISFITVHLSGIIQQVRIKMDPSLAPHHSGHDHAPPHGHGQMLGMQGIED